MATTKTPESSLYRNAASMPLAEVRMLRIGDVLEAYYADAIEPILEMVVEDVMPDGDRWSVRVLRMSHFTGEPRTRRNPSAGPRLLNTDKFKLVGRAEYNSEVGLRMVSV